MKRRGLGRAVGLLAAGVLAVVGTAVPVQVASAAGTGAVITSFTATPGTISSAGGKVTFAATVTGASGCSLSSTPAIAGLPATVGCGAIPTWPKVWFPSNAGSTSVTYKLMLAATPLIPGPLNATKTITVSVGPPPATTYVALGDSYSSGEGNPGSAPTPWPVAYPKQVSSWLPSDPASPKLPSMSLRFVACSGATTSDLWNSNAPAAGLAGATGNHGEQKELLDTGDLAHARIVTVSIGGNDLSFSGVIKDCVAATLLQKPNCGSYSAVADLGANIQKLGQILLNTYLQIEKEAPHAALYVVGYPAIFPSNPNLGCVASTGINQSGMKFLASNQAPLEGVIKSAAEAAGAVFVDPNTGTNSFAKHNVCSLSPWVNGLVKTPGEQVFSFHPNHRGQNYYTSVVKEAVEANSTLSNPGNWAQQTSSTSPAPVADAAEAWDPATSQLILFGGGQCFPGAGYCNVSDETWAWTGSEWRELAPTVSPAARAQASIAYDPASKQLVLYGGLGSAEQSLSDTWIWTGDTWQQEQTLSEPSPREAASLGYDPVSRRLILFGGSSDSSTGGPMAAQTWSWNGASWSELSTTRTPPPLAAAALVWDSNTSQLILYGGIVDGTYDDSQATWSWNGSNWVELSPSTSPPPLAGAGLVMDNSDGQLILFGGYTSGLADQSETWSWDGNDWLQLDPRSSPPARSDISMAYDESSRQIVLFGGAEDEGVTILGDTWVYA